MKYLTIILLSVLTIGMSSVFAQGALDGYSISGKAYFDYSKDISKDGPRANGQDNGFMFRRLYLTINKTINDDFSIRFRTDADRKADAKMRPFVKHAYLQWKNFFANNTLYVGMSGTPTWGVAEKVWGYRGLDKTVWDNFKGVTGVSPSASSADVGFALKGSMSDKMITYKAMIGNGSSYSKPESDKYKKFYLSVAVKPTKNLTIEGYVDQETKDSDNSNLTYKGFAGYTMDKFAIGAEYYMMTQGGALDTLGNDRKLSAFSVFGRFDVTENATAILRYDMYDPDTDTDDTETSLVIAALDYRPSKKISIIPNFNYYMNTKGYDADEDTDIVGKLTFVWAFK